MRYVYQCVCTDQVSFAGEAGVYQCICADDDAHSLGSRSNVCISTTCRPGCH
jgi:hypothetical protein